MDLFSGHRQQALEVRNDAAGSGLLNIGGNYTQSSPYVSEDGWVYFQGTYTYTGDGTEPGHLWNVFNDGTQQSQLGGNYTGSTPKVGATQFVGGQLSLWVYFQDGLTNDLIRYQQTDNPPATGTARPKYYILTSPLCATRNSWGNSSVGTSNSLVDYGSQSATGTTTTIADSLKAGFSLGLTGSTDDKSLQGNFQFSFSENTTDSSSISIQKAESFDIKIPGPATDGIDHNHDVFMLLLNPLLTVAQFPRNQVQLAMGVDGPTMNIQYVYAGCLKGVTAMAPGVSNSTPPVSTLRTISRSSVQTRSSPDRWSSTPIGSSLCRKASPCRTPRRPPSIGPSKSNSERSMLATEFEIS